MTQMESIWGAIRNYLTTAPYGASLVAWESACQTEVRILILEDPTSSRTTKGVCHSHRACALEPGCHSYEPTLQTPKPVHPRAWAPQQREATTLRSLRTAAEEWPPLSATREKPA